MSQSRTHDSVPNVASGTIQKLVTGASMAICDLCSASVDTNSTRYKCEDFRRAVKAGLRPPSSIFGLGAAFGIPKGAAEAGWVQQVMSDTTDWVLCEDCAQKTKHFFGSSTGWGCLGSVAFLLVVTGGVCTWLAIS